MSLAGIARSLRAIVRRGNPDRWKRWHVALVGRLPALLFLPFRLNTIGLVTGTDKAEGLGRHAYLPIYETFMRPKRFRRPLRLLEIGIGGYERWSGGRSCHLWRLYFPFARIVALDIVDKTELARGRLRVVQGSQADVALLRELGRAQGPFDFVIDDGSHVSADQIASFEALLPFVAPGGVYAVEDLECSYPPRFGGAPAGDPAHSATALAYFERLADRARRHELEAQLPPIASIAFHRDLCVIHRGARRDTRAVPAS